MGEHDTLDDVATAHEVAANVEPATAAAPATEVDAEVDAEATAAVVVAPEIGHATDAEQVEMEMIAPGISEKPYRRSCGNLDVAVVIEEEDLSDYGALPTLPRVEARRAIKDLVWKDLTVTLPAGVCGGPGKELLKKSSGRVKPGEFLAIMGPSGAGKTTLLNTLAGRSGKMEVSGSIMLGGETMKHSDMRSEAAYVMQEDALYATATVRESFNFSAGLRLKANITDKDRLKIVDQMLKAMGLTKAAETMVGSVMIKGVSGGEKKRTAIGVELLSDPNIIFLDEPTSGLDSFAAFKVITLLRTLCASGCTVITTIHQPSSEVFALFDRTYLLAEGRTVYDGQVSMIPKYFSALGKPCPEAFNPADHIMFVMQMAGSDKLESYSETWAKLSQDYNTPDAEKDAAREKIWSRESSEVKLLERTPVIKQFLQELRYLGLRELRNVVRDKVVIISAVCTTIFINTIVGGISYQQGNWGPSPYEGIDISKYDTITETMLLDQTAKALFDVQDTTTFNSNISMFSRQLGDHFGALIIVSLGGLFGLSQPTILNFPLERPIFLREYASQSYSWASYFMSKFPKELVFILIQSGFLVLVSYFLVGFKANFFFVWFTIALLGLSVSSCAMLLGTLASNAKVAIQLSPLILVPQILFSGFQLPISKIPVVLRWAQYLCSLKYSVSLFNIIEFDQPADAYNKYSRVQIDDFLKAQETNPDIWYIYVLVLLAITFGFRLLSMFVLALKSR